MAYKVIRSNGDYRLYLTLTRGTPNVAGNYTPVTVRLYLKKNSGTNWAGVYASDSRTWSWSGSGITNRSGSYVFDFRGTKANYGEILLRNETFNVAHNSNGSRGKLTVSATVNFAPSSIANSVSISESVSFTTIPRASTFTLGGATRTNASVSVSISRKSSAFTHRVRWRVGSGSWITASSSATTSSSFTVQPSNMPNLKSATITVGVQTYNGTTAIGSEATATRTITIPNSSVSISGTASTGSTQTANPSNSGGSLSYTYAWTLAGTSRGSSKTYTPSHSHLPNSTSGTLKVTLTTKNGSATINTTSATRTITVPSSIVPTTSSITHSEQDSTTAGMSLGKYVQGKSRIKIGVNASAGSGASITGYTIKVDGQTATSNNSTTGVIKGSGTLAITATVRDSRGRTSSTRTQNITVLAYSPPYLSGANGYRTTSSGERDPFGTYSRATFKMNATSLEGKNTLAYEVLTSEASGANSNSRINVGHSASNLGKTITTSVYSNFTRTKEYQYTVILKDKYGTYTFKADRLYIPTAGVNLAIGYGGVATTIGKLASHGDTYNLEVGDKGMRVDGPIIDKNGAEPLAYRGPLPSGDTRLNSYWMTMENGIWYLNGDTSRVQGIPAGSWGTLVKTTAHNTGIGTSIFEVVYTAHKRDSSATLHNRWIITGNNKGISPWRRISMEGHTHSASEISSGTLSTSRIPNLPASKITSGTIADARLPAKAKPADFIVERDSNLSTVNGYEKWNSGLLRVWARGTISSLAAGATGSLDIVSPVKLTNGGNAQATVRTANNVDDLSVARALINTSLGGRGGANVRIKNNSSATRTGIEVQVEIISRWK